MKGAAANLNNEVQTAAVVGPGSIGGTVAARLIQSGLNVILIGRDNAWLRGMRRSGIEISSDNRSTIKIKPTRFVAAVRAPKIKCGLVLICVKSSDTKNAVSKISPLIGPDTAVVSVQNGLTHVKPIVSRFGAGRTVFGITVIAAHRLDRFRIRHEGGDEIFLAPHPGNARALASAARLLKRGGWKVRLAPSEDGLLWTKAAFNACTNPIGALAGKTNGELINTPALCELVERSLQEAIAVAAASGHRPLYHFRQMLRVIKRKTAQNQPNSMLQDIRAGRKTEADAILLPILDAAKRGGVAAPTLQSLYRFIKSLEKELHA